VTPAERGRDRDLIDDRARFAADGGERQEAGALAEDGARLGGAAQGFVPEILGELDLEAATERRVHGAHEQVFGRGGSVEQPERGLQREDAAPAPRQRRSSIAAGRARPPEASSSRARRSAANGPAAPGTPRTST
jgi:hypothetical protein